MYSEEDDVTTHGVANVAPLLLLLLVVAVKDTKPPSSWTKSYHLAGDFSSLPSYLCWFSGIKMDQTSVTHNGMLLNVIPRFMGVSTLLNHFNHIKHGEIHWTTSVYVNGHNSLDLLAEPSPKTWEYSITDVLSHGFPIGKVLTKNTTQQVWVNFEFPIQSPLYIM